MPYMRIVLLVPAVTALLGRGLNHVFAWAYLRQARHRPSPGTVDASVSIVVPVRGLDPAAADNFRSLYAQVFHQPYEIIFAVEDPDDAAVPLIQTLVDMHPAVQSQLVFSGTSHIAAVGKLRNLIAGVAASRYAVICFVDSDVRVSPSFLHEVAGAVADPQVGLAFAVPVSEGAEDWVAALHNLFVNGSSLHYLASAFNNRLTGAVGSIMVTRRDVLVGIGGLEQFGGRIVGVDISLGQAVHGAGYHIQLLPQPARIRHAHDDLVSLWRQLHRWLVTIRRYYPAFPIVALLSALPLTWTLLFLAVAWRRPGQRWTGLAVLTLAASSQIASAATINRQLVHDRRAWRYIWLAALGEVIWLPVFIHSLRSDTVYWRGRQLRVRADLTADYLHVCR